MHLHLHENPYYIEGEPNFQRGLVHVVLRLLLNDN